MSNVMTSLGLQLNVSKGYNQIQQQLASYKPLYLTIENIKDEALTIPAVSIYEKVELANVFVLSVASPVTLEFDTVSNSITTTTKVQVNKLFVADFDIHRYAISTTVETRVNINSIVQYVSSGTPSGDLQDPNTVLAGPESGAPQQPTFRPLVEEDLPEVLDEGTFSGPA